jgi:hypothetical protein
VDLSENVTEMLDMEYAIGVGFVSWRRVRETGFGFSLTMQI